MFQFPGFPFVHYGFMYKYTDITLCEFPHSEIFGSKVACTSPKLIAAYHVLHRLPAPRHSPYALYNLTFSCETFTANCCVVFRAPSVTYFNMLLRSCGKPPCISRNFFAIIFLRCLLMAFATNEMFVVKIFYNILTVSRWNHNIATLRQDVDLFFSFWK